MRALKEINYESGILNNLCDEWHVEKSKIVQTGSRFFSEYKKNTSRIKKLDEKLLDYQMKYLISNNDMKVGINVSDYDSPSIYFSFLNNHAEALYNAKKGVIFYADEFIYGLVTDPLLLPEQDFKKLLENAKKDEKSEMKYRSQNSVNIDKKKKLNNVYQFVIIGKFNVVKLTEIFNSYKFSKL